MRLALYASAPRLRAPNLVAIQDETLASLPTVLVCPLRIDAALTGVRAEVPWREGTLIACCDLARPIRRSALRPMGWLDPERSRAVMERFLHLLAR